MLTSKISLGRRITTFTAQSLAVERPADGSGPGTGAPGPCFLALRLRATRRNIYVRSQRTGEPVLASLTGFLTQRLKLKVKVNVAKGTVARPWEREFLGYSPDLA